MPVSFSSGDDYSAGDGVSISSATVQGTDTYSGANDALAALAASANDPYEAELLQQAATGGSGGLLGAGFNLSDGGDSGQPSLAELQALTAINQSIRNQYGLGSVTPQQTFFALRDIARQSPTYRDLGFVQGLGGINVPSFNLANAQLMRPMAGGVDLSMSMMTPSGVRGIGQIPKAPVQDPVTGQYYVDGKPVDKETAEYMMEARDDVYGVLPDPKASFGSEMFGKVKSFFTGEEPDPAAGFKDYGTLLNMGGEIDPETGNITTKVGKGELKYNNRFGITTYSGPKDDSYRGPFENLIRPAYSSDDGPQQEEQVAIKPITEEEEEQSMIRDGLIMPEGGYFPTTGRFLRFGLLDQPIDTYGGLLAGQDPAAFEAMNMAFRRPTNVEYFQDPYDMTGYTLI
jgi:hypothetical protein